MKLLLKHIVARTYKPLLTKYLSKTRMYNYGNIRLEIPPQVFHPGFFFSTRLLLRYISALSLEGQRFLELGAGSGLISIYAAKNRATVTATDINPVAVECLRTNNDQNKVKSEIILSDLFDRIPEQSFDIIAINPPYYKKQPKTIADHAWYCGENGEYFEQLFIKLGKYIHKNSIVLMVLSEECDIKMISEIASGHNFYMQKKITKKSAWEYLYIYQITRER
ncbi:MAG TPA: methyltransferase [Chitinophagaceae bacterium]|nr:methyltransferase [Chitinophagaceae bacterium]